MAIANKAPELPGHPDHKGAWFNSWLGAQQPGKQQPAARAPDVEAGGYKDIAGSAASTLGYVQAKG
jgi:hypothetical protein